MKKLFAIAVFMAVSTGLWAQSIINHPPDHPYVYTVEGFGAVGDGATDDTAAINAAISAAEASVAAGGGYAQVIFAAKTYSFTFLNPVTVSNVSLIGQSSGSPSGATGATTLKSSDTTHNLISIAGTSANCASGSVGNTQILDLTIQRVSQASAGAGISIVDACSTYVFGVTSEESIADFYVAASANTIFANDAANWFTSTSTAASGFEIDSTSNCNNSTWIGQSVVYMAGGSAKKGINLHGACVQDTFGTNIETANVPIGIYISSTSNGSSVNNQDIRFTNSVLDTCSISCISINNVYSSGGGGSVQIMGGYLSNSPIGIDLESTQGVEVSGFEILGDGFTDGIKVAGANSSSNQIVNNQFVAYGGTNAAAISVVSPLNLISGNSLTGATYTSLISLLSGATNNNVTGNVLTATAATGISFASGANSNYAVGNQFNTASVTTPLSDGGTGNITSTMATCSTVSAQTSNYTGNSSPDSGVLVTMNGSNLTYTFNGSPSATYSGCVQNLNATALAVSMNGKQLNGIAAFSFTMPQYSLLTFHSDGSNYFADGTGQSYSIPSLGATTQPAVSLVNPTLAATGAQQVSPSTLWQGQGFSPFTTATAPTQGAPTGTAGACTSGTHRFVVTYLSTSPTGETTVGATSSAGTACGAGNNQTVPITAIPVGSGVNATATGRNIYESKAGTSTPFFLACASSPCIADNTTTTFNAALADASLVTSPPGSITAGTSQDVAFQCSVLPVQAATNPTGQMICSAAINGGAFVGSFAVNPNPSLTVPALAGPGSGSVSGITSSQFRTDLITASTDAMLVQGTIISIPSGSQYGFSATTPGNNDTITSRCAVACLQHGAADAAAPVAQAERQQGVLPGTSNTAGASYTIQCGAGTGTGIGGVCNVQNALAGSTGSAQNAYVTTSQIGSPTGINFPLGVYGTTYKSGSNGRVGTGTLASGTLAVSNTSVTANSFIFVQDTGGGVLANIGSLTVVSPVAGTGFTVTSTNALDTSTFKYWILETN